MNFLVWLCGGLAIINCICCMLATIRDDYIRAIFHLIIIIWMWYITTTI